MRLTAYQYPRGYLRLFHHNNVLISDSCNLSFWLRNDTRAFSHSPIVKEEAQKPASGVSKELLLELRRRTGFSFLNCRKAVVEHGDNIEAAVAWLNELAVKQGWEKATKMKDRTAKQGLVGVLVQGNKGALVEMNCETDFVARSPQFRSMMGIVAECVASETFGERDCNAWNQWLLDSERLSSLSNNRGSSSVGELLSYNMGQLGERLSIRRALRVDVGSRTHLHGYTHPRGSFCPESGTLFGQYGTLLALGGGEQQVVEDEPTWSEMFERLGGQLCQHVIGMQPTTIGVYRERTQAELAARLLAEDAEEEEETEDLEPDEDVSTSALASSSTLSIEESSELVNQSFILHPAVTVGEFLAANDAHVVGFERFALGEDMAQLNSDV